MELNYLIYMEEVEQILGLFLETIKQKKKIHLRSYLFPVHDFITKKNLRAILNIINE